MGSTHYLHALWSKASPGSRRMYPREPSSEKPMIGGGNSIRRKKNISRSWGTWWSKKKGAAKREKSNRRWKYRRKNYAIAHCLILAMAKPGFKFLGQVFVQFIIVWHLKDLKLSFRDLMRKRRATADSRLSIIQRYACNKIAGPKYLSLFHQ